MKTDLSKSPFNTICEDREVQAFYQDETFRSLSTPEQVVEELKFFATYWEEAICSDTKPIEPMEIRGMKLAIIGFVATRLLAQINARIRPDYLITQFSPRAFKMIFESVLYFDCQEYADEISHQIDKADENEDYDRVHLLHDKVSLVYSMRQNPSIFRYLIEYATCGD